MENFQEVLQQEVKDFRDMVDNGDFFLGCPDPEECEADGNECQHGVALDYEMLLSSRKDLLGLHVIVSLGGPHIEIDTRLAMVTGHWGGFYAKEYIKYAMAQEMQSQWEEILDLG